MVLIKPFQALHPNSSNAKEIACFPYDVAYESEVREFVQANPNSFLRVTRPEADFNSGETEDAEAVLDAARANLESRAYISCLVVIPGVWIPGAPLSATPRNDK